MPDSTAPDDLAVTTLARRPDLLPIVTDWVWREWWQREGLSFAETQARYAECLASVGPPQTFVLLSGDVPVGTASLARQDLEQRPDLTPWLAGVFVVPERRRRGYVTHLLAAFDKACAEASIETAWLYTSTAERVYRRAGWDVAEIVQRPDKWPVTLMRRTMGIIRS